MQLQKNLSVTVVRNQFCAVLTETWISDSNGARFGSTSRQNICDNQMLQMILSQGAFGQLLKEFVQKLVQKLSCSALDKHISRTYTKSQLWTQCIIITEVSCISLQVIGSHMEMFNEVDWKKMNATTQELVCNCRSESVLRTVN